MDELPSSLITKGEEAGVYFLWNNLTLIPSVSRLPCLHDFTDRYTHAYGLLINLVYSGVRVHISSLTSIIDEMTPRWKVSNIILKLQSLVSGKQAKGRIATPNEY